MSDTDDGRNDADALLDELLPAEGVPDGTGMNGEQVSPRDEGFGSQETGQSVGTSPPNDSRTVQAMGTPLNPMVEADHPLPADVAAAGAQQQSVGRSQLPPTAFQEIEEEPKRRNRLLLFGLFGLLVIAGFAAIGYWVGNQDSSEVGSEEVAGVTTTAVDPASPGASESTEDDDTDTTDAAAETTDTTSAQTSTTEEAETGEEFPDQLGALTYTEMRDRDLPHTVFSDGMVFFRGRVPNQAIIDLTAARVEPILGAGNFVVEFTIDPTVPIYTAAPVYVEDVVLFDFNSTELRPDFFPLLELGTETMLRTPGMTARVVAFTDAVGSEEVNKLVATERAQAVVDYWVSRGIDPSRITIDARGEAGASEDDDEQTAALNRRVEFIFDGLLN